jgi:hypothetical protein
MIPILRATLYPIYEPILLTVRRSLDEYFAKINETPAYYASVVTNPKIKWAYFEYVWKDAILWKDARALN